MSLPFYLNNQRGVVQNASMHAEYCVLYMYLHIDLGGHMIRQSFICPGCSNTNVVTSPDRLIECEYCGLNGLKILNGYLMPEPRRYLLCSKYYHIKNMRDTELVEGMSMKIRFGRSRKEHEGILVAVERFGNILGGGQFLVKTADRILIVTDRRSVKCAFEEMGSLESDAIWKNRGIKITNCTLEPL